MAVNNLAANLQWLLHSKPFHPAQQLAYTTKSVLVEDHEATKSVSCQESTAKNDQPDITSQQNTRGHAEDPDTSIESGRPISPMAHLQSAPRSTHDAQIIAQTSCPRPSRKRDLSTSPLRRGTPPRKYRKRRNKTRHVLTIPQLNRSRSRQSKIYMRHPRCPHLLQRHRGTRHQ